MQRGAEELTRILDLVYTALITVVDQAGGSVIGFSGDAVTCWFDRDSGLLATVDVCEQGLCNALSAAAQQHLTGDDYAAAWESGEQMALDLDLGSPIALAESCILGD